MIVADYSEQTLQGLIAGSGLRFGVGPFTLNLQSSLQQLAGDVRLMYASYPISSQPFADFHVRLDRPFGLRRWFRPQVNFTQDTRTPFKPLPLEQSFAMFEWGLNWCISSQCHQYLIIHAAVVERGGLALIMPAPPGSGKSTLCAGLVARGWRLLTDELALVSLEQPGEVIALPRPVSLKNESIDVIRAFAPEQVIGPIARDTAKGTVAHMAAPVESVERAAEAALSSLLVFPQYTPASATVIAPRQKAVSFMELADQSFNFNVLGELGFQALRQVLDSCDCYDLSYSQLDDVIPALERLIDARAESAQLDSLDLRSTGIG
ncbi:MAG: HprK-related kinase A [Candidatus Reddybacter sp.]